MGSSGMSGGCAGAHDLDQDGLKDLFTTNSNVSEFVQLHSQHSYKQLNAVFRNLGDGKFLGMTAQSSLAKEPARAHRGCAFGDLNNDGAIDVVVSAIGEPAELFYWVSPNSCHWLLRELSGHRSNRDVIGAATKLTGLSGRVQYNQVTASTGFLGSPDLWVHFGLGADTAAREIEVRWPGGGRQVLKDTRADRLVRIVER